MARRSLLLALLLCLPGVSQADQEAANVPVVVASRYGNCYAKAVPSELYGGKGVTKVFRVEPGQDQLVHTFDWYARELFLECNVAPRGKLTAISVVRFGPWHRGHHAAASDLAMAFYWDGRLVGQYSTLDLAGAPQNVEASISHYTIIRRVEGFRWRTDNEYSFEIVTTDGRHLSFDPATGQRTQIPN